MINAFDVDWPEKDFEEEGVREVVFNLGGDKAPVPDGFPLPSSEDFGRT